VFLGLLGGCGTRLPGPPAPTSLDPDVAVAGVPVEVVIRGTGFDLAVRTSLGSSSVTVGDTFRAWLGETELTAVTWVDPTTLRATVPALAPGAYALVVESPWGRRGTLADALTARLACALESCADGCCSGATCTHGNDWPTCGGAGAACAECDPTTSNRCDEAGGCTCGATGATCAPGEICVGSDAAATCRSATCDAATCPDGCCTGSTCAAPTRDSCGAGGGSCSSCDPELADGCTTAGACACGAGAACVPGQRCAAGACGCEPSSCPNGCCAGKDCVAGIGDDACGTGGMACQSCAPDTCTGGACSGCNATTCAGGCCSGATCAARGLATCGTSGKPCTVCDPALADGCSSSGACQCGGGASCSAGTECVGGACHPACPADMVRVGQTDVCIDRYEASADGSAARSVAGVAPWVSQHQKQAGNRCDKAGKRLCTAAEWQAACGGGQAYPYGGAFVAGQCNDSNDGQCLQDGTGVLPTGSKARCVGAAPGLYDMSGNVWEWLADTAGGACVAAGGSVDACGDAALLACDALATFDCNVNSETVGFRCCLTQAW
jgi:hypothetical protein